MRASRTSGSVEGVLSDGHPYSDSRNAPSHNPGTVHGTFRNMGAGPRLRYPIRRIHKKRTPAVKARLNVRPSVPNSHARQRTNRRSGRGIDALRRGLASNLGGSGRGRATSQRRLNCALSNNQRRSVPRPVSAECLNCRLPKELRHLLMRHSGRGLCCVCWIFRIRANVTSRAPTSGRLSKQAECDACPSRIRCQAATGSWTRSLQWETQRRWLRSAGATVCLPAKVSGVWPSNDAWQRAAL
jgi:hypothetical protein